MKPPPPPMVSTKYLAPGARVLRFQLIPALAVISMNWIGLLACVTLGITDLSGAKNEAERIDKRRTNFIRTGIQPEWLADSSRWSERHVDHRMGNPIIPHPERVQAEIYFGGSAAAITSFLTLGMTINSRAAFGFAASSSLDSWASRHCAVATVPVDR